jgi:hypothetical protein
MTNVNSAVEIVAKTEETKVAVINLLISCISEDRQIDLSEIGIVVGELPEATRKMMSEKIFPRDFLRSYHRIREQAEGELDKDGSIKTTMGGINSRSSAISKIAELEKLKAAWNQQLAVDGPKYAKMCETHLLNIGAAAIKAGADSVLVGKLTEHLMKRQPSWEQVSASLKFSYVVTIISLDEGDFDPELMNAQRDSVVALRDGVMGALVQNICKEAFEILKLVAKKDRTTSTGQIQLNPRTIRRAQQMVTKLESLAFIHKLIRPLHDAIKAQMDKLPASGALTGSEFRNFEQCLTALRDQTLVWERLEKGLPLIEVTPVQAAASQIANAALATARESLASSQQSLVMTQPQAAVTAPAETVAATTGASVPVEADVVEASVPVSPVVESQQEETVPAAESSTPAYVEPTPTVSLFDWV